MGSIFENNEAGGWIWTHSASHQAWYRDPCPICGEFRKGAKTMAVHIRDRHGFKLSWVCTYKNCKREISGLLNMREHVYGHTKTRPYACNALDCSSNYPRENRLRAHSFYSHNIAQGSWALTPEQRKNVDVANNLADKYIVQILLLDNDGLRIAKKFLAAATATLEKAEFEYITAKAAFDIAIMARRGASAAYNAAYNTTYNAAYNAAAASCDASDGQDKVPPQLTTQPLQSPRPSKRRKHNEVSQNKPRLESTTETSINLTTRLPTLASFPYSDGITAAGYPDATQDSSYPQVPPGNGTSAVGYTENPWESAAFNAPESRHYGASYLLQMCREPMYSHEETTSRPEMYRPPPLPAPFQNREMEGNRYPDTDAVEWRS